MPFKMKSFWPATGWFVFATVSFCLPGKALPQSRWFDVIFLDKWIHITLFAVLVLLICLPFFHYAMSQKKRFFLMMSVAMNCFLYGVVMEVIQFYFIPNRSFDLIDIVSDGIGCFVGWYFIHRHSKQITVTMICFYGPESTGKSTLAKHFAEVYKTEYVPEVSREMISSNNFTVEDIIAIAKAQTNRIFKKAREASRVLFCDTDLITTQIYSQYYLKTVPPILFELEKQVSYDHYFLFDIDVPWVADTIRDLGSDDQRKLMFEMFKSELDKRKIKYVLVRGSYQERENQLKAKIDEIIY